MEKFKLLFSPSVEKDLDKIPNFLVKRILAVIETLSDNPYSLKALKLTDSENKYRIRQGEYRIVYEINKAEKTVLVQYVRHRKDAY